MTADRHHDHEHRQSGGLRWMGPLLLLLWEVGLLWILASGRYTDFLRPSLWPLILLAALLSGALLTGMLLVRGAHETSRETVILRTAVLAVPLLYLVAGHGKTLGSSAYGTRAVNPLGASALPPEIGGGRSPSGSARSGRMSIPAILRRGPAMHGKTVRTIGQIARGYGEPEGHFILFRFVVNCCIADATPRGLLVREEPGESLPADAWVEVKGTIDRVDVGPRTVLLIRPESIRSVAAPDPPYLYGN